MNGQQKKRDQNPLATLPPAGPQPEVPGYTAWFEPGTPEYQEWHSARNDLLTRVRDDTSTRVYIIHAVVDAILEGDVPTGPIGAINKALKITGKARSAVKNKKSWTKVLDWTIESTFSSIDAKELEFKFTFGQVAHLWRAASGEQRLPQDKYENLYSVLSTKLKLGDFAEEITAYPSLARHVTRKLIQYKSSYHRFRIHMDEG